MAAEVQRVIEADAKAEFELDSYIGMRAFLIYKAKNIANQVGWNPLP